MRNIQRIMDRLEFGSPEVPGRTAKHMLGSHSQLSFSIMGFIKHVKTHRILIKFK